MRLLGPKTPRWVVNNRYGIASLICIFVLFVAYGIAKLLSEIEREPASKCGFDCPDFMYYHDGGASTIILLGLAPLWLGVIVASFCFAIMHIMR